MTATDELRRLLDESGVEYRAIGDATFWETHDGAFRYKAKSHAEKLMVMTCCSQKCTVMTPEQAIAATLGGGRLTAEQVRELIAPHLHARPTFDFGHHGAVWSADFQAIADELNATLGNDGAAKLQAENVKLRELVRDIWRELNAEVGSAQRRLAIVDRLRELRIEVDA